MRKIFSYLLRPEVWHQDFNTWSPMILLPVDSSTSRADAQSGPQKCLSTGPASTMATAS